MRLPATALAEALSSRGGFSSPFQGLPEPCDVIYANICDDMGTVCDSRDGTVDRSVWCKAQVVCSICSAGLLWWFYRDVPGSVLSRDAFP